MVRVVRGVGCPCGRTYAEPLWRNVPGANVVGHVPSFCGGTWAVHVVVRVRGCLSQNSIKTCVRAYLPEMEYESRTSLTK